jgi:hypothetical protein
MLFFGQQLTKEDRWRMESSIQSEFFFNFYDRNFYRRTSVYGNRKFEPLGTLYQCEFCTYKIYDRT